MGIASQFSHSAWKWNLSNLFSSWASFSWLSSLWVNTCFWWRASFSLSSSSSTWNTHAAKIRSYPLHEIHMNPGPQDCAASLYLAHVVGLHVVYDEALLGKLDPQQLDVVQQLPPLDLLAGHLLGVAPLLVGRGQVLGGGHRGLQADVLRLQVQGAGDVDGCRLQLVLLGRHLGSLLGGGGGLCVVPWS